jgi:hypothetical protein
MIYYLLSFVGRPDPGYAPCQFIPFDPFLSGGIYCSAAAHYCYPPYERERVSPPEAVAYLLEVRMTECSYGVTTKSDGMCYIP